VVTMNSLAIAVGAVATFLGANFMLIPRWLIGADDSGAAAIILIVVIPVAIALLLATRFPARVLGPDDTARAIHGSALYAVATGWLHGARTVLAVPSVSATLAGLAAHRMVFAINTMLVLVIVRHTDVPTVAVAGLGIVVVFVAATSTGSFLSTVLTPATVKKWGRYATANGALLACAAIQLAGAGLRIPVMVGCGFLLGAAGQMVKLCVDSAMQIDVDDALRGHVFAVQDSLFWLSFIAALAVSAAVIPPDGHTPALAIAGSGIYLVGLVVHALVGRRAAPPLGGQDAPG
jgi:hypothetical protein